MELISCDSGSCGSFVGINHVAQVTAVIVTFNSARDIGPLLMDLRDATRNCAIRVIVVDNDSSDNTVAIVRSQPDVTLVESGANVGYPAAINLGLSMRGDTEFVVILNPDLRLLPGALVRLLEAGCVSGVGAVVPLMLEENEAVHPSLGREPSILGALGDAVLTSRVRCRPRFLSEYEWSPAVYSRARDVDWATGAAVVIPVDVVDEVGDWWEELFAYSEEVDYFRRIRATGRRVRFEPSAIVVHRGGGSGRSEVLTALKCVNRIRYVERYHSRAYGAVYRFVLASALALRSKSSDNRYALSVLVRRRRWADLPRPPARGHG